MRTATRAVVAGAGSASGKDGSHGSGILVTSEAPGGTTGSDSQPFGGQQIACWGMVTDNRPAMFDKDRPRGVGGGGKCGAQVAMGLAGSIDGHCPAADFSVTSMGQDGVKGGVDKAGIGRGMAVATGNGVKGAGGTGTVAGGSRA